MSQIWELDTSPQPRSSPSSPSRGQFEPDPIQVGRDAIALERENFEQAPSITGASALAKLHAQVALSELLEGGVQDAEATLRSAFDLGAQMPTSASTALYNDLAICAMHDGRSADALPLFERALQALPRAPQACLACYQ